VESADSNYDGLDPKDIEIKGLYIKINGIIGSTDFISGLEKNIDINSTYTGSRKISYSLLEKPDDMTIFR